MSGTNAMIYAFVGMRLIIPLYISQKNLLITALWHGAQKTLSRSMTNMYSKL